MGGRKEEQEIKPLAHMRCSSVAPMGVKERQFSLTKITAKQLEKCADHAKSHVLGASIKISELMGVYPG